MRRALFRIGGLFAAGVMLPFPLGVIPGTRWLAGLVEAPFALGVRGLAAILGVPPPWRLPTGSGDTTYDFLRLLLVTIVAVIAGAIWAAADRRPHPPLAPALRVWLRYWLALSMLVYGLVKVLPLQFNVPLDFVYDQRVGDKSPMGLLWLFMAHSRPYTVFAGCVELAAGMLLLGRRTTTLGAIVAAIAMTQVVMLNFCYDVPVKLYSLELLLAAIAIGLPDARRLLTAALGRATPEVPPRVRSTPTFERVRLLAKAGLLLSFAADVITVFAVRLDRPAPGELAGGWDVTTCAIDGAERPPLATDDARWARLVVTRGAVAIRFMTDRRATFRAEIDEPARTISITNGLRRETLRYERRGDDRLVIDGAFRGQPYRVELARAPATLLESRGFHWIQEEPFHR